MIRPIMPAWPVLILLENRAPMEQSAHLAPLSATNVQAAEAQIRAEMGFPAALAERDYHPGQSGSRGFQWESFSELGEWCICTRCMQQPHDCVGPRPVTAGFAEPGCNLLAQTSRGHILTGSGAKKGCCLPKSGATSVESGFSRGCRWRSRSARRAVARPPSVELGESTAVGDEYSTSTLGTTG